MSTFAHDNPALRPFVISNVRLTGVRIGSGAYGSVEEVAIPGAICAAKKIHEVFLDRSEIPAEDIQRSTAQFVAECQLMSTLRHPHIVQFLGVCFFQGSRLPALVMERLLTSLHDLLDPETHNSPQASVQKLYFPLGLKSSVLHNVASGLIYLHERSSPIIHRDLSARNVLLNSAMIAKITDLGVARIAPLNRKIAATMTKAPGASIYMPPEATASSASNTEKSKYGTSIDIFSFGIISIFTLSQVFPCDLLEPTYVDEETGLLKARTELERRGEYIKRIYDQLRREHPLIKMIRQCLHNAPAKRPAIRELLHLLNQAKAEVRDEVHSMNKLELIQTVQNKPSVQSLERDIQQKANEIIDLKRQLRRKDADLAIGGESWRKERQQTQEQLQREQSTRRDLEIQLRSSEALVAELLKNRQQSVLEQKAPTPVATASRGSSNPFARNYWKPTYMEPTKSPKPTPQRESAHYSSSIKGVPTAPPPPPLQHHSWSRPTRTTAHSSLVSSSTKDVPVAPPPPPLSCHSGGLSRQDIARFSSISSATKRVPVAPPPPPLPHHSVPVAPPPPPLQYPVHVGLEIQALPHQDIGD